MIQTTNISLIPSDNKPVINVSQFDNVSRVLRFNVFDDIEMTVPHVFEDGDTVLLNIRKNDNNIVVITGVIVSDIDPETQEVTDQYLTFELTEQACACVGSNYGEVSITSGDDEVIGSCNFKFIVERSPLAGGLTSQSAIDNLTTQIEQITEEVIGENYYTKTETDNLLDDKADSDDVYTKTETDNLLNAKADANNVYTKTETDNLLNGKADSNNVYTKTETDNLLNGKADSNNVYTKTETDNLLNGKADSNNVYTKTETDNLLNGKADANNVYTKTETDNNIAALIDDTQTVNNKAWSSNKISDELYALLPVGSASGSIASFNTALAKPLVSITVDENATKLFQRTINLWDGLWEEGGIDNNTGENIGGSTYWRTIGYIPIKPNNEYFISSLTGSDGNAIRTRFYDINKTYIGSSVKSGYGAINRAFTPPDNAFYVRFSPNISYCPDHDISLNYPSNNTGSYTYNGNEYDLPLQSIPVAYIGDNNFFTDYGDITVQYKDTIQNYIDTRVQVASTRSLSIMRTIANQVADERTIDNIEGVTRNDNAR